MESLLIFVNNPWYNSVMKIVQAPDPVLSQVATKIEKIDKDILQLIADMKTTLLSARDPEGIGLAAPQVGKSVQLFIIKQSPKAPFSIYINPVLKLSGQLSVSEMKKKHSKLEGCLSLQDIWGTVKRSPATSISYLDEKGKKHTRTYTGFFATILQHEYDHLQGILFPKRVLEQQGKLYKSKIDEKGEVVFDPLEL
ncbi:MAG: peptide deformylase [Candidatus Levyibacteriota bacterium]